MCAQCGILIGNILFVIFCKAPAKNADGRGSNMLIINYGSVAYFIPPAIILVIVAALFFMFRRRSAAAKKAVVLIIMAVNILQHVLKQFIYPHYFGNAYPDLINTAYNMCATLILLSPVIFFSRSRAFRQFLAYVGTIAGLLTMAVPHWYIGQTMLQWDVFRYYFCHGMLVASSFLPAAWGLYKMCWRDFWKFPFIFFFMLILIAFNDLVFWCLGVVGDYTQPFFEVLYDANPCWMMHPNEGFSFLLPVIDFFTPDIFFGDAAGKPYTPILWYAIPLTLLIWILGLLFGLIFDGKNMVSDIKAAFTWRPQAIYSPSVLPPAGNRVRFKRRTFAYRKQRRRVH